ncbi:MAG: 23S rRNA (uracil(1939)-C(5))-methyltransferase RlmD [Lachnospiraceae bacterium]|nr:23S rRNA (uracil(1939)-C(5))-methyltransferase RlmD [Lachnospiraceae bacterium]
MNYKKNDYLTVKIEDMSNEGEGIGKVDGFTLFVKDTVIGDTAKVKLVKVKKNYAFARLEEIIEPSANRVEPVCPVHRQCGGCQLQSMSYESQLQFKERKVRNNLIRIGGFSEDFVDSVMEPIVGMEEPLHYRNKAQYPVGTDKDGNPVAGFYAGRTHSIIPNLDCALGAAENEGILKIILEHMKAYHIPAYDETTGRGLVRHVLIRKGFTSGEIMVCLVLNWRKNKDKKNKALEFLRGQQQLLHKLSQIKGMTSISVSINTEQTNVIMGQEIHTLWGNSTISDTIHVRDMSKNGYPVTGQELTFHISPLSFYQVNPVQTEKLYSLALQYAGLTGKETVWDLYCGIGTISLFLATHAGKVCGVEIVPQAIENARENAIRNGITNAEFYVGKAEEVLPVFYERMSKKADVVATDVTASEIVDETISKTEDKIISETTSETADKTTIETMKSVSEAEENDEYWMSNSGQDMLHPDVIVVDPPRKGCDEACLETMLKMRPERIVYVSCDSATLARDLKVLCEGGYEVKKARAVDQFGMTVHVEVAIMMQLVEK